MRQPLLVISLFISFLLCGNLHAFGKEPEPYYPLKEGMTWEYQVMFHTRNELLRAQGADKVDKSDTKKLTVTNLASQEIDGKKVSVVTDLAERPEEINEKEAQEAIERAEHALKERERLSEEEFAVTAANLQKALAQLKIKRRHRR